jgi:hypothetical protein
VYSKKAVKQYNVYVGLIVGPTVGIGMKYIDGDRPIMPWRGFGHVIGRKGRCLTATMIGDKADI